MAMIMGVLPRIEQLRLQGLDKWWYTIGVSRVQVSLEAEKMFYFYITGATQIIAVRETGECKRFSSEGMSKSDFKHYGKASCQVGQSRLFQVKPGESRFLKMNRSERSFTIERVQKGPDGNYSFLTNFKDQFVFGFSD